MSVENSNENMIALDVTQKDVDEQAWSSPYGDERPNDAEYLWM